ncbi:MAG: TldD/PmbA family protein [Firmicutes bacterium]|nr:TldD/PmbA family protein [Bacillota bacterium]
MPPMVIDRDQALQVMREALNASPADQTEVVLMDGDRSFTRYANSVVHQNMSERNLSLGVRVAIGKRLGHSSTNVLDSESVRQAVDRAVSIARLSEETPDFVSLPRLSPPSVARGGSPDVGEMDGSYVQETAEFRPEQRAGAAAAMFKEAASCGFHVAGAFSTEAFGFGVANSLGVTRFSRSTQASLTAIVGSDKGSGYSASASRDARCLDPLAVVREASEKCSLNRSPVPLEPGEYDVILEGRAVAEALFYLGYMGFGALAVQEGRSFMSGSLGKKLLGENITLWDDGLDPAGFALPFDFEGVPKRKVVFFERGVARDVVYDSLTAGREGKSSTGHALPAPNTMGPIPVNLFLEPGEAGLEEIISGSDKAVLVTRFHYIGLVHPSKAVLTGMTRDGTFLVEKGRISRALKNLRFTESMLKVLSQVEAISRDTVLEPLGPGAVAAPALKVRGFCFTGVTG